MLLFSSSSPPHVYLERERVKKNKRKSVSMAVEARHLNLFPSQLIGNREFMNAIEGINANAYNTAPAGFGLPPVSGTTMETLLPMYNSVVTPANTGMKSDSGLTYALPVSRKRSRDSIHPLISFPNGQIQNQNSNRCGPFTFLGEDISLQVQQQQLEVHRLIAQHTEKLRLEVEERRKRYSRRIIAAVEEGIANRLRAKEEEIEKIGKLNWALEERVKSLCVENQIWRNLAQTNEATANALRSNLEHVLAQVNEEHHHHHHRGGAALDADGAALDDAESSCGSNYAAGDDDVRRTLGACEAETEVVKGKFDDEDCTSKNQRLCRHCGKVESLVLLLPCRHLCLCTVCGSSVHTCPVCNTPKNASVHVIMSS
ncbi:probable BOI-related E3 ubiquitin-protein ligase 3 [Actinidia eriantha]|uniref:probable BOI-related E3 ubiquitin-protein ligase 3 n=1 Tax=Actinidia eriantha TaxID=165200 RepID=UPI00258C4C6D|nr:probable BOI-related E3 ubiquitin-protein ligase 3 [Actinidia eriantha]